MTQGRPFHISAPPSLPPPPKHPERALYGTFWVFGISPHAEEEKYDHIVMFLISPVHPTKRTWPIWPRFLCWLPSLLPKTENAPSGGTFFVFGTSSPATKHQKHDSFFMFGGF